MSRPIQMLLFLLFFSAVLSAFHWYIWYRLIHTPLQGTPWKPVATALLAAAGLSIPLTMIFGHSADPRIMSVLAWPGMVWLGAMMLFLFALLLLDAARGIFFLGTRLHLITPPDDARRLFMERIAAIGVTGVVAVLTIAAVVQAARPAQVIRHTVALSKFPAALSGFTIAQISDIHVGLTVTGRELRHIVQQVNDLKPDVIVITGDLVDGTVDRLRDEVEPLRKLRAPHGVFFSTGNHEYYSDEPRWVRHLTAMGIRVLANDSAAIGRGEDTFLLAGVNDVQAARMTQDRGPDVAGALKERSPGQEVVLLSHQPKLAAEAAAHDVGLMLSGHTHGGQIWPFSMLVALDQPCNRGFCRFGARTIVYVNQGTGLWGPPMRLGTTGEISLLTLRRE